MKKIKVKLVDQSQMGKNFILDYLRRWWDVEVCDDPDYLLCSCFGHEHLKYDCVKIFFSPENVSPDFNFYDYAIGYDYLTYRDRYLRIPFYNFYPQMAFQKLVEQEQNKSKLCTKVEPSSLLNREFCSFVVSNIDDGKLRIEFFNRLSKYKRVASGGRALNNIGGPCRNKIEFISKYKFNIAFENSSVPGYTTEKIVEPLVANTVPIYWGNPCISNEFNPESMIILKTRNDIDHVIDEIIYLDTHDEEYLKKIQTNKLVYPTLSHFDDQIKSFFTNIFEQPLEDARRTADSGAQRVLKDKMKRCFSLLDNFNRAMVLPRKIRSYLKI